MTKQTETAPERIWVDATLEGRICRDFQEGDIEYIRADLTRTGSLADDEKVAREIVGPYMSIGVNTTGAALVERIASAISAAREQVAEQWRPIETAPKDVEILAYFPAADGHESDQNVVTLGLMHRPDQPTYWIPLPAGPQENQENGQ